MSCDDVEPGDLVEVSVIAGMSFIMSEKDTRKLEDHMIPVTAIYLGHILVDYGVDKDHAPLVLYGGRKMIVDRGSIRRV